MTAATVSVDTAAGDEYAEALAAWNADNADLRSLEATGRLADGTHLDDVEAAIALQELRDKAAESARALLAAKKRRDQSDRAAGNRELVELTPVHETATDAVGSARAATETALVELAAATIRLAEAVEGEKRVAQEMRVAASRVLPKDALSAHAVPIRLLDDGTAETRTRPTATLFDLRYAEFDPSGDRFAECVHQVVRRGRQRLGGSEHSAVNERFERRVKQRLEKLDADS